MFFQINRGQIVNINAIQKIHPYLNQRLKLELSPAKEDLEFLVNRPKASAFKEWIDG